MLQVDPYVVRHEDMQSFNRYTYVSNNPLNRVDSSGHCEALCLTFWAIVGLWGAEQVGIIDARTARQFTGIAVAWYLGPAASNG
jgi:hypothetical protein